MIYSITLKFERGKLNLKIYTRTDILRDQNTFHLTFSQQYLLYVYLLNGLTQQAKRSLSTQHFNSKRKQHL